MQHAPGQKLLALTRRVLSRAEVDRIIEPAIADLQHEWAVSASAWRPARLVVRTRAYAAALRVVSRHLLVGALCASLTLPRWAIVRQVIAPSIVMLVVTTGARIFLQPPRSDTNVWLLEIIAYWIPLQMAWMPILWPTMVPRRELEGATISAIRASDIARLTAAWCLLCLLWTGWIAPFLRHQCLIQAGQGMRVAEIEQWMLPSLLAAMSSDGMPAAALELHRRLILVALTPISGVLAWITLRPRRRMPNSPFAAHLVRGIVLAVAAIAIGIASEPAVGRIGGEWIGVVAAATGALLILTVSRLADRRTPEPVERDA